MKCTSFNASQGQESPVSNKPQNGPGEGRPDLPAIDNLVANYGNESAARVLKMFCDSTPDMLDRMAQAIGSRQSAPAVALAHELKGTCAMMQFEDLAAVCRELEKSCRESLWSEADILVLKAKECFAIIRIPIEAFCQSAS